MGSTPVCQITAAGIVRPTFPDCLSYEQTQIRAIYGADLYLGADSQDGQLVALRANAYHDANGETVAAYNSFSPATAQGVALDRVVKINGIRRKRFSYSTAPFRIVGQAGASITGGIVTDAAGDQWALPSVVLIPDAGEIVVTATCQTPGAIGLSASAIDTAGGKGSIATITRGWQAVNNVAAASVGQPVESDSALRQRQAISTALPSQTLLDGLNGALAAASGVTRLQVYNNTKPYRDANGIPGHCIAVVVDGGDAATLAEVIQIKKGPGVSTYGSTIQRVIPATGPPEDIAFFYLTQVPTGFVINVQNLGGFTLSVSGQIQQAVAAFVNGLAIGEDVERDQAFAAAKLYDGAGSKTFKIVSFAQGRDGVAPTNADVPIAFTEAAMCDPSNVIVNLVA